MDFLDFFFPEQAQASHLRQIAAQNQQQALALHRERFHSAQEQRQTESRTQELESRVQKLERDVGQAGLVIEALIELLEEAGTFPREAVASRTADIDARDGTVDGRQTPPAPPPKAPFVPKRKWNGPRDG